MIDFTPIHDKKINWTRFGMQFGKQDLIDQTNEMTDCLLSLIGDATDEDVVFTPLDPEAHDPYAADADVENIAWNLGHVIVHLTASNEESAFLAAELARGVEIEPHRSRWEVDWETMTTIEQCRHRLEESRRMLLGSLAIWPDEAHLDNFYKTEKGLKITPVVRFLLGQNHTVSHIDQIKEIMRQAKAVKESIK